MTSLMAKVAAALKEKGVDMLDAPVSGGDVGAINGTLSIMVGGDEAAFQRAKPAMDCYGKAVTWMGPPGAGQLTKMVNQICIAGVVQGLSEAINFGLKVDLDMAKVIDVICKGAAQSWQMDNRAATMIEDRFDFGFAVEWMRKDMGIALTEARNNGAMLPASTAVDQFYAEIVAMGGSRWDTSSLIRLLTRKG